MHVPNRSLRSNDLPLWQYIAAIGIPAIPFVIVFVRWSSLPEDGAPISFADSVEMINAFLGAAAFAAVVLTLLLQRKDLHEQSHQFQEAMRMQALGTYLSVVECRREMTSSRPMLPDDSDIKTLHLAVSLFQINGYLDRIEGLLQRSNTLAADAENSQHQLRVNQMRHMIARIATLDLAVRAIREPGVAPAALRRLTDWMQAAAADPELPDQVRAEIRNHRERVTVKLNCLLDGQDDSQMESAAALVADDLDRLRILLVRAVRSTTVPATDTARPVVQAMSDDAPKSRWDGDAAPPAHTLGARSS